MAVEMNPGEWLVWDDASYYSSDPKYVTSQVVKATGKTVTHRGLWSNDTRRNIDGSEVWCGDEVQAKTLVERLTSSAGLMKDERRRAKERHLERVVKIVAAATPDALKGGAK